MNLIKRVNAIENLVKLLVIRNLSAEVWGNLPRLGKVVGALAAAVAIALVLGIAAILLEGPKEGPHKVKWSESYGLPYKPRGLF